MSLILYLILCWIYTYTILSLPVFEKQSPIKRWISFAEVNHWTWDCFATPALAPPAREERLATLDLLHSLAPPARAGVRMRLAAQRQVQVSKSPGAHLPRM